MDAESHAAASTPATLKRLLLILQAVVLTVVSLYFGKPVLLPLFVSGLLATLLYPAVHALERRKIPRPVGVIAVMAAVVTVILTVSGLVLGQLNEMSSHLDEYRAEWRQKIDAVKKTRYKPVEKLRALFLDVSEQAADTAESAAEAMVKNEGTPAATVPVAVRAFRVEPIDVNANGESTPAAEETPQLVRVMAEPTSPTDALRLMWGAVSEPLALAAVVFVLTAFMLLEFDELRNRLLRLAGQGRVMLTTKTLDDAGRRISRYLMATGLVNFSFGLAVFSLLWVIGVGYAVLWGFLAAVLRFIPYVGPITAAVLPIALSVVQFPGWGQPALVVGGFIILELITNNVVEPLAYGRTAGVSTVALLVSATFWAWIWGPVGLALSIPITVVLAVLGRNVPQLDVLGILLGDAPVLSPPVTLYQRLLARDIDDAAEILEGQLAEKPRLEVYDALVLPVLVMLERDAHVGQLSPGERDAVIQDVVTLLEEHAPETAPFPSEAPPLQLLAYPAQGGLDDLALTMLKHLLPEHTSLRVLPRTLLTAEKVTAAEDPTVDAVLIASVGKGVSNAGYLCKRLRQSRAELRILVGRWDNGGDREPIADSLKVRGASQVTSTLEETLDAIRRIQPRPAVAKKAVAAS